MWLIALLLACDPDPEPVDTGEGGGDDTDLVSGDSETGAGSESDASSQTAADTESEVETDAESEPVLDSDTPIESDSPADVDWVIDLTEPSHRVEGEAAFHPTITGAAWVPAPFPMPARQAGTTSLTFTGGAGVILGETRHVHVRGGGRLTLRSVGPFTVASGASVAAAPLGTTPDGVIDHRLSRANGG